ncbi:MAG TPA: fibrobacter succinogenes major paralogous domain-containing protein [Flavobacteriales bacterium]|nr:fibrobacter succinogenes major paralogous domain-containing protein [Flavobacteriales bacterium]
MRTLELVSRMLSIVLFAKLLVPSVAFAQTVSITFTAVQNGSPVTLDSVVVENLDAGGDTVYFDVGEPFVLGTVGMGEAIGGLDALRSIPSHFKESTEILVSSRGGELLLSVFDATGRVEASTGLSAMPGEHRFRFTSGQAGIHFVNAVQNGQRRVIRIVASEGTGSGASAISYMGSSGSVGQAKSDRSLFSWQPGDALRFTGYITDDGNVLSRVVEDEIGTSGTIHFMFGSGVPCSDTPIVTDIDGNAYGTVQIGSQCWMAQNLTTTRYRDGSMIQHVTDDATWVASTASGGVWCNYLNGLDEGSTYGKLYNWYAVDDTRGVCPQGWHMPSDEEWTQLVDDLGGQTVAGGKLKSTATGNGLGQWQAPNPGATNETGFTGLGGGSRGSNAAFAYEGQLGGWWSASEDAGVPTQAWTRQLNCFGANAGRASFGKGDAISVRCIRD